MQIKLLSKNKCIIYSFMLSKICKVFNVIWNIYLFTYLRIYKIRNKNIKYYNILT